MAKGHKSNLYKMKGMKKYFGSGLFELSLVLEIANHGIHGWGTMDFLGEPKSRRTKKKVQNLRDFCVFCFLWLGDQNRFLGQGMTVCVGRSEIGLTL